MLIYVGTPEAPAAEFKARAAQAWPGHDIYCTESRESLLQHADQADGIIALQSHFDDELLRRARKLRWIHTLTSGTDAVLKQPALSDDIILTSTRGIHGPQMSELVFLQMLALLRDFPRMLRDQSEAHWERRVQPLLWHKTVTIVGVGAIARALALRCKAFEMRVVGVTSSADRAEPGFDSLYGRNHLTRAVAEADFVVLLVPHSDATEKLINAEALAAMKPSAYLINVARGGVLDEDALLNVLRSQGIAGAALDVFREQPLPKGHPFWHEPRVLVTPLIGGMSDVYLEQMWPTLAQNISCFIAGTQDGMLNVVPHGKAIA